MRLCLSLFFFFNDTATPEISTLSLHDALPICLQLRLALEVQAEAHVAPRVQPGQQAGLLEHEARARVRRGQRLADRKSTRLNSSHLVISYAVFCLKKKKQTKKHVTAHTTAEHR